jgi:hypothetical protein
MFGKASFFKMRRRRAFALPLSDFHFKNSIPNRLLVVESLQL